MGPISLDCQPLRVHNGLLAGSLAFTQRKCPSTTPPSSQLPATLIPCDPYKVATVRGAATGSCNTLGPFTRLRVHGFRCSLVLLYALTTFQGIPKNCWNPEHPCEVQQIIPDTRHDPQLLRDTVLSIKARVWGFAGSETCLHQEHEASEEPK